MVADDYVGAVMSDLSSRRGRVLGTEPVPGGRTLVKAEIPELEITRYAIDLRSMSHGTGSFARSYLRYEPLPSHLADKVAAASKPGYAGLAGPGVGQQLAGVGQQLRQHLGPADHRHEVGVAAPPRHHVLVQVSGDARARHAAHVHADVEALRAGGGPQRAHRLPGELGQLGGLGVVQLGVVGHVPVRAHHQVTAVVRVQVEHRVDQRAAGDDERLGVRQARDPAERAVCPPVSAGLFSPLM